MVEPRFQSSFLKFISRDYSKYLFERKEQDILSMSNQQVYLTINTWTSCQNMHYMCSTAHFIDDN